MKNSLFLKKESGIKKTLPFFESGLFLISLVLIVIIVFFGALNYFNILALSSIYPKQLGFLPHQKVNTNLNDSTSLKKTPSLSTSTPLTQNTLEQEKIGMVPISYKTTKEWPYGYELSFQQSTIATIEQDKKNNSVWLALTIPGDKLTRQETGQVATNFTGDKTKLYDFTGLTVWVELLDTISVVGSDNIGQSGLKYIIPTLKIGDRISLLVVSINQPPIYKNFQDVDLNTLKLLNSSVGQLNNDKTSKKFVFKADTIFVNRIVK